MSKVSGGKLESWIELNKQIRIHSVFVCVVQFASIKFPL